MIDISKIWPFVCGEVVPGSVLAFDCYLILYDSLNKVNNNLLFLMFIIISIVFGIFLSALSNLLLFPLYDWIVGKLKIETEPIISIKYSFGIVTLKTFFSNMILPIIIFGISFSIFMGLKDIRNNYFYGSIALSIIAFILSIIHEKYFREGKGFYID